MSSKVNNFGTNHVCNFLLVRHGDYGLILHRFSDTATYWLKPAYLSYPSHLEPPLSMFPLEFRGKVNHEEASHGAILQ